MMMNQNHLSMNFVTMESYDTVFVLELMHDTVIAVQVHIVVLQPIDLLHDARPACIRIGFELLIPDTVVYVSLVLQEMAPVGRRLLQHPSLLHVDPLKLAIWFYTITVEVLEHVIVF